MVTPLVRPGIYTGWLRHRRTAPVAHAFRYPLFMVLLDVDRLPALLGVSRLTGYNRRAWASFHEADHFGDPALPLRQRLALDAAARGLTLPDGPIYLLTHLRYLGHVFNPVSFYYCYDGAGRLRLVMAEVNNTFGGRHNYWLEPDGSMAGATGRAFSAEAGKAFYVSPFMPADMQYRFALTPPGGSLVVHMDVAQSGATERPHAFDATLSLVHHPWTAGEFRRVLLRHPVMTATVVAGIHWEALRLWLKGLRVVPRPTPDGVLPDHAAPHAGRL